MGYVDYHDAIACEVLVHVTKKSNYPRSKIQEQNKCKVRKSKGERKQLNRKAPIHADHPENGASDADDDGWENAVRERRDVAVVERNETLRCHRLVVKRAARPTARQVCAIRLLGSGRSKLTSTFEIRLQYEAYSDRPRVIGELAV